MEYALNCTIIIQNITIYNLTGDELNKAKKLEEIQHMLYGIIVPLVCVFGFVGNILNVIIFTQKKGSKVLDEVEYCTTICLVALAISDMMFCLTTFPNAFILRNQQQHVFHKSEFILYYRVYSTAIISTFIMSSTMMTVLTALMRYLAICHPFRSRQFITIKTTIAAIVIAYLLSFTFNIPYLWRYEIIQYCLEIDDFKTIGNADLHNNPTFVYTYKVLWAIFGNFIPLIILLYCNIRLIRALHISKQLRLLHSRDDTSCLSAHRRINITLITIIILFFILVAPSEITKFIFYTMKGHTMDKFVYSIVSDITNTLQTINFSVNFILYYVIIAPFRKTLNEFVCAFTRPKRNTVPRDRSSNSGKQTVVLLSVKDPHRL